MASSQPSRERRKWARLPSDGEQVELLLSGQVVRATVVGQSIAGVELRLQEPLEIHREVAVVREGATWRGLVRWSHGDDATQYRVGIEWLDGYRATQQDQAAEASFLAVNGMLVVCRRTGLESGRERVELPDGSSWELPEGTLVSRTFHERKAGLADLDDEIETLVGLYGLDVMKPRSVKIDLILDYEFAQAPGFDQAT